MEIVRCASCNRETYAGIAVCPHCGAQIDSGDWRAPRLVPMELRLPVMRRAGGPRQPDFITFSIASRDFEVICTELRSGEAQSATLRVHADDPAEWLLSDEPTRTVVIMRSSSGNIEELTAVSETIVFEPGDVLRLTLLSIDRNDPTVMMVRNVTRDGETIEHELISSVHADLAATLERQHPYRLHPGVTLGLGQCGILLPAMALSYEFVHHAWKPYFAEFSAVSLITGLVCLLLLGNQRRRVDHWRRELTAAVRHFIDLHIQVARHRPAAIVATEEPAPFEDEIEPPRRATIH